MGRSAADGSTGSLAGRLLAAALVAGSLDALAAALDFFLSSGRGPAPLFRFIASGVFGPAALQGGAGMALAGLAFHYLIAAGWTLLYAMLRLRLPGLRVGPLVAGPLWALVVWLAMSFVVLPLSRTPPLHRTPARALRAYLILVACIGLPIAGILAPACPPRRTGVGR